MPFAIAMPGPFEMLLLGGMLLGPILMAGVIVAVVLISRKTKK